MPVALAPTAKPGHGLIARLYEAIAGGIHERATSAALTLQAAATVHTAVARGRATAVASVRRTRVRRTPHREFTATRHTYPDDDDPRREFASGFGG